MPGKVVSAPNIDTPVTLSIASILGRFVPNAFCLLVMTIKYLVSCIGSPRILADPESYPS